MSGDGSFSHKATLALTAALGIFFLGMTGIALGYSLRDALGPGPGFFPFWLGLVGAGLCAVMLVQSWRGRLVLEGDESRWPDRSGGVRTAWLLAGIATAALLFEPLGFRLTAFAFTTSMLLVLGVRRPILIIVFGLVCGFGLFHVFYYWLKVPLPIGRFGI